MDLVRLSSNRPAERFYQGGRQITDFRGDPPAGPQEPEDWVASTTTVAGESVVGLTTLPDGRRLVEAITTDPRAWLGADHLACFGLDTRLLVKLLDAGQRLPVHAHPDVGFAAEHLGRTHGKAEAWYILTPGVVYLGLRQDMTLDRLLALLNDQDIETMLGLLHRIEVQPHDVVFVPPGLLHAIGADVFLVELQEPEDLSILLEWRGFALDGRRDGHLGLGFELALQAVERRGRSEAEISALVQTVQVGPSVLPIDADRYFRLERVIVDGQARLEPGFAVLICLGGSMSVDGSDVRLDQGSTVVAPHLFGELCLRGRGEVLICRPPVARHAIVTRGCH